MNSELNNTFSYPYAKPITYLPPLNAPNFTFNPNNNNDNNIIPNYNNSYNVTVNPIYSQPLNLNPSAINPSLTVAPPIPSYYKQNINAGNYYNHLPNIAKGNLNYSTPELLAKSFSNNLNKLKDLEDKISKNKIPEENLPPLSENRKNELKKELKENANYKITSDENPNLKNNLDEIKKVKQNNLPPDFVYEQEIKEQKNKELMSKKGIETFNDKLSHNLNEYSNMITNQIKEDNDKNAQYYNMIRKTLEDVRNDISKQIDDFNNVNANAMSDIRKIMVHLPPSKSRMKLLAKRLLPDKKMDEEEEEEERRKKNNDEVLKTAKRMSIMLGDNANLEKQRNLMEQAIQKISTEKKIKEKGFNGVELDLWEKKRVYDNKLKVKVDGSFSLYDPNNLEMKPINKFRKYVYVVIAARRILNVQYMVYKTLKFNSVSYFLTYYEDMDIILKKNIYYAIVEPFTEIITNKTLDLNVVIERDVDQHQIYIDLQDYLKRIIKGLQTKFFQGISDSMLKYLSLFISNYSYIPSDFFTLFELVRFKTTETGEFIDLNKSERIMILGFYIIIKILLRNLFLEMIFTQNNISMLNKRIKLNIKMVVSVLFRGLIKYFRKECVTRRNLEDLDRIVDKDNFFKICYGKKEFHVSQLLSPKRYYLKEAYTDKELGRKKRISERVEVEVNPDNIYSSRKPRQTQRIKNKSRIKKNKKAKKFREEEEEESEDEDNYRKKSKSKSKSKSKKKKKSKKNKFSDDESSEPRAPKNESSSEETPEKPIRRKSKRKKTNLKQSNQNEYYKNKQNPKNIKDLDSDEYNNFDQKSFRTNSLEAKRIKKKASKKEKIEKIQNLK